VIRGIGPIALGLALVLAVAACGDSDDAAVDSEADSSDPPGPGETTTGDGPSAATVSRPTLQGVTFDAGIEPGGDRLIVSVRLTNGTAEPLVVVAGADARAENEAERMPLYALTGEGEATVELSSRIFAEAGDPPPTAPHVIPITRVPAGATWVHDYTVPLPLSPRHPYLRGDEVPFPEEVQRVTFCLGVAREAAVDNLLEDPNGSLRMQHVGEPDEALFCTEPVDVADA
jgi:hypothetical protein